MVIKSIVAANFAVFLFIDYPSLICAMIGWFENYFGGSMQNRSS